MKLTEPAKKVLMQKKYIAHQLWEDGLTYPRIQRYLEQHFNFKRSKQWMYAAVKEIKEIKAK